MGRDEKYVKIWLESLKSRINFKELGINGRITFKLREIGLEDADWIQQVRIGASGGVF